MSFSSFLLAADGKKNKGKIVDKGLDDLFRTATATSSTSVQSPVVSPNTASTSASNADASTSKRDKKRKHSSQETASTKSKKLRNEPEIETQIPEATSLSHDTPSKSKSSKAKPAQAEDKTESLVPGQKEGDEAQPTQNSEEPSSDEEGDPSKLVHESVASAGKTKSSSGKVKYVPTEETTEQRDARTVFVGNVPVEVVKSRPLRKQFERHILSFAPSAKIESTRFRSVAFQKPTAGLPTDDPSSSKSSGKPREKEGRQHDRERAATWRASNPHEDEDAIAASSAKTFLTPQEKKRVAFIKQEIHSSVDSVNAYVVFAHPVPVENRPKNLPPPKPVMDPYEAAKTVITAADGSVFMERTIRVDSVSKDKSKPLVVDADMAGDPKAAVFVGNLDFASKEEDVRAFFEGLVITERGQPPVSTSEDDGSAPLNKQSSWVKRVRVIRDKDTLLGKGFCYVQFIDRECVDEVLALEQDRLKFAKRKLRVQRCKTLPGAPKIKPHYQRPAGATSQKAAQDNVARQRTMSAGAVSVPKGDPSLGKKIAGLTKEERKKVKSTDADRVARRLAKKKAKALADKGVKARDTDRERIRKRPKDKKGGAAPDKGKKRVRSDRALLKMNSKK